MKLKGIVACVCAFTAIFACACGSQQGDAGLTESSVPEVKALDEASFGGTYTKVTAEKAKGFFEDFKNVKGIGDGEWWNDYFDANGGARLITVSGGETTSGYGIKDENGLSLSATTKTGEGILSFYSDGKAVYVKSNEGKEKHTVDAQTEEFWTYIGIYDLMGEVGSYRPSREDSTKWVWAPETVRFYGEHDYEYYMDETELGYAKIKMVISGEEGITGTKTFICKDGYIVAYKGSSETGETSIVLLPWTGTIEKPADLNTYTERKE